MSHYLDGDHRYEGVKADLEAWLPKMKPGGVLGGDDWPMPGVQKAVGDTLVGRQIGVCKVGSWAWWWTVV